jgi:Cof subfamily protein (haloacid dehalogenase superfamily)
MSSYRMIAIDLDGTLLSPGGHVTPRAKAAVHSALAAGLLVCFATGRNWTESQMVLDAVEHYASAVFAGGAMVIDTHHRVTLHRTMMEPTLAAEVCGFLESSGHAVLALQDAGTAGMDYLVSGDLPLNEPTALWMKLTNAVVHRVPLLGSYQHEHTIRVGIVASGEQLSSVREQMIARFGDRIVSQNLAVPAAGVEVLEVFDPAVNKWEGIMHVARRHQIEPEQIIAIGDDVNDVPMIRNAGLGVAMGNAKQEVKSVAKRVIGSNREEGLAVFLEELIAQHQVEPLSEDRSA